MKKLTISIDFDGTIASERFPKIGVLMHLAKETINKWYALGHTIIINTCRAGTSEDEAKEFLINNGINFHYINENDPERIEFFKNDSRKIGADVYIDDKSIGTIIDWVEFDRIITKMQSQKPLIIAIVGRSGSGKTTLAEYMELKFGINLIESHTDRPKRHPNEIGHTFHTKEEFDKFKIEDMIAYTDFGDKRYCCLKSDVRKVNTYVIDEKGLNMLLDSDEYDIVSIRTLCSINTLRERTSEERLSRDRDMFNMQPYDFDYRIRTDAPLDEMFVVTKNIVKRILKSRL